MGDSNAPDTGMHDQEVEASVARSLSGDDAVKALIAAVLSKQERATTTKCDEGIMVLLNRCLSKDPPSRSLFALSTYVDHYASKQQEDLGWGCGWRNIQMLTSHLLQRDKEAFTALFGGAGFVPSIAGLQLWLEIAWKRGFDTVGAEQLGWAVASTHKWIGTTECAALLRSFGFRAFIVDFKSSMGQRGRGQPLQGGQRTSHGGGCGPEGQKRKPLQGPQEEESGAKRGDTVAKPGGKRAGIEGGQGCPERPDGASGGPGGNEGDRNEGGTSSDNSETEFKQGLVSDVNRLVSREHYSYCPECNGTVTKGPAHTHHEGEGDPDEWGPSPSKGDDDSGDGGADTTDRPDSDAVKSLGRPHGPDSEEEGRQNGENKRAGGGHGDENPGSANHMRLVEWVWDYFTDSNANSGGAVHDPLQHAPVAKLGSLGWPTHKWHVPKDGTGGLKKQTTPNFISNKPPLYFQHQGHSRTIVGIERRPPQPPRATEDVYLLVLDPSQQTDELVRELRAGKGWQRMVKRSVYTLRKAEYQLCYIEPGLATGDELESLKVLQSVLYSY